MPPAPPIRIILDRTDCAPLHPGEILREDLLPYHKVTPPELARYTEIPLPTLDAILDERAPITRPIAQRLGAALGQGARYWLALQLQYDLWHGASEAGE
jgi:antitoxin HigA-1